MIRAVRATLASEPYKSRFAFSVHGLASPAGQRAQRLYPFGRDAHGFVVVDRTGEVLACRPGHFYGQSDIEEDFDRILGIVDDE